ncbi:YjcQ family protein [Cytobacillus oceanisediminis]|uniref:Uncharacterized protein n=1 Tax=Cytobacillus oceanisediminis 2691 TaxID=1196031 RepID=A0A160MBC6_9BACI|nr:YjcQ family protein [Cytobacillus oceanisediminis]AND39608.1 hypothetical protein A361_10825 [Cytobacillus oceanisediminis 2691]
MIDKSKVLTARLVIFNCIMEGEHADPEKCDVTPEEFIEIVQGMDEDRLIRNVAYSKDGRGKALIAFLNTAEITPKGEAYIDELIRKHS